ncbi:hypothetical protein CPC08DRAFT_730437 [Agrocybe pediades]|nr:hypothetical protein CPC08DRAFT_730437 [Agrocybe pediades]
MLLLACSTLGVGRCEYGCKVEEEHEKSRQQRRQMQPISCIVDRGSTFAVGTSTCLSINMNIVKDFAIEDSNATLQALGGGRWVDRRRGASSLGYSFGRLTSMQPPTLQPFNVGRPFPSQCERVRESDDEDHGTTKTSTSLQRGGTTMPNEFPCFASGLLSSVYHLHQLAASRVSFAGVHGRICGQLNSRMARIDGDKTQAGYQQEDKLLVEKRDTTVQRQRRKKNDFDDRVVRPIICMISKGKPGQDIAWHMHLLSINNKEESVSLKRAFPDQRKKKTTKEERTRWAVGTVGRPPPMYEMVVIDGEPLILLYRQPVQSSTLDRVFPRLDVHKTTAMDATNACPASLHVDPPMRGNFRQFKHVAILRVRHVTILRIRRILRVWNGLPEWRDGFPWSTSKASGNAIVYLRVVSTSEQERVSHLVRVKAVEFLA